MAGTIFISYRRTDTAAWAGRISDDLEKLPGVRVVFDVVSILPGQDFVEEIRRSVRDAEVVLAVIGASWLNTAGHDGQRRLDDPLDFVRLELEIALQDDAVVIPVLIDGAPMPREGELPQTLRPLAHRNAVSITHANFKRDVDYLRESIRTLLAKAKAAPAPTPNRINLRPASPPPAPPKPAPEASRQPEAAGERQARERASVAAQAEAADKQSDLNIRKVIRDAFVQLTGPETAEATLLMFEDRRSKRMVVYTRAKPIIALTIYGDGFTTEHRQKAEAFLIQAWPDAKAEAKYGENNRVFHAEFPPDDIERLVTVTLEAFEHINMSPLSRPPKVKFGTLDFSRLR